VRRDPNPEPRHRNWKRAVYSMISVMRPAADGGGRLRGSRSGCVFSIAIGAINSRSRLMLSPA